MGRVHPYHPADVQFADGAPRDCHAEWERGARFTPAAMVGGPRHGATKFSVPVVGDVPWTIWLRSVTGDRHSPLARYSRSNGPGPDGRVAYVYDGERTDLGAELASIIGVVSSAKGRIRR